MTFHSKSSSFIPVLLATLFVVACSADMATDSDTDASLPKPAFTADGALEMPEGYRE